MVTKNKRRDCLPEEEAMSEENAREESLDLNRDLLRDEHVSNAAKLGISRSTVQTRE